MAQLRVHDRRPYYLAYNTGWFGAVWKLGTADPGSAAPSSDRTIAEHAEKGFPFDVEFTDTHAYVTDSLGVVVVPLTAATSDDREIRRTVMTGGAPSRMHMFREHAYLFTDAGLRVIDVRDVRSHTEVAALPLYDRMPYLVAEDRAYFYSNQETDRVLDLSEPASPRWIGEEDASSRRHAYCTGSDEAKVGDLCYRRTAVAGQVYGIEVYRMGGRDREVLATLALGEQKEGGIFDEYGPIAVAGAYVYVVGIEKGLFVLDATDAAHPKVASLLPNTGITCQVAPRFDLAERGAILNRDCHHERMSIQIEGDRLFLQKGGLWVIDISDPAAPRELGIMNVFRMATVVVGGTAYVAGLDGRLAVFEVPFPSMR